MAVVFRGEPRRAAGDATTLVIAITDGGRSDVPAARISVSVKDEALSRRIEDAMTRGLREAVATPPREVPVLRVRSRKAAARLGARVAGAIAIVPVRARNLRRLGELTEALRDAGAAGVQLVWDGREPPREAAEARIFAVLEASRATPSKAKVVLSPSEEPAEALQILIDAGR